MAEMVFKKARVILGSSDGPSTELSTSVRSVAITYSAEIHDKTAMGSSFRKRIAGLKDWNATIEMNQHFNSTTYEKLFWNLVGGGDSAAWLCIFPDSKGTTLRYYGRSILESLPIGGAVGELATVSLSFQGNGGLTRATNTGPF